MFKPVDSKLDIQSLEQSMIEFWRMNRVFRRTTETREGAPRFVFYEGPPTANGKPGSHHVLARSFKDMFPRYKVMNGYYVERLSGWDTHGLPVEIAVEKELGLADKRDIETYGIAKFNEKCRQSVFRNIADWEKLTERTAYWVDLDNAYVTFTNDYIQSVWWLLQEFWKKNLLYRGYKVVPYSPSSGTVLSSHEVSLGYKTIKDPSVYVRFPLQGQENVYFLAWTTTPWTLPANAALAVGEDIDYVQVEGPVPNGEGTEQLIMAEVLMPKVLLDADAFTIVKRFKGRDLLGMRYQPLFNFLPTDKKYAYVVAGDFVSTGDGTGIVHIAPAFGQDDYEVGQQYDLPVFLTVNPEGRFINSVDQFKGMWFKDADPEIIFDLKGRGLMYRSEKYEHSYPHNWRDGKPLMYMARDTWFIRTTQYKDRLVELNKTVNWVPEHIRDGRFGNWLEDLKDWALGRERYWGTPLPIWIDDQTGEMICIGSVQQLSELVGRDLSDLDLHRPYVDDITFANPSGKGGTMRRVPEVIDVWFDSGAMQVAQWGYPYKNQDKFEHQHPADYICEAVDQTRGWFYSLHAISSILFDQVAYKNVICLGLILDGEGQKMSKSKGNTVDPWDVINTYGADAFRWYLYTSGPPGETRRFSLDLVGEVVKKFTLTLWNTYSFFVTYANIDGWTPATPAAPVQQRNYLDRWVLAELHRTIKIVTQGYESYDVLDATRPIEAFVEALSNWYVRLSRRRFWKSESDTDKANAYATLYECLTTLAHLLAPAMPFMSDAIYRNLVHEINEKTVDSIHLSDWPAADEVIIDDTLLQEMSMVRHLVSLGLSGRNAEELGVRQPLSSVSFGVTSVDERAIVDKYAELISDELNVKAVRLLDEGSSVTQMQITPVFARLGRRLKGDMQSVKTLLEEASAEQATAWGRALLDDQAITVQVGDRSYVLEPNEVQVRQEAVEGFTVFEDRGYVAVLDVHLTDELVNERIAREVVRRIQMARKDADFQLSDRIEIEYKASNRWLQAIEPFGDYIMSEVLADSLSVGEGKSADFTQDATPDRGDLENETLVLHITRVRDALKQ